MSEITLSLFSWVLSGMQYAIGSVPDSFLPAVLAAAGTAAGSGGRKELGTDPIN